MALEQKLSLKLAQKLVMTPSLQQAIKLLQLTRMELETVLNQELVENPVLEERDETPEEPEQQAMGDIDIEAYFNDYWESNSYQGQQVLGIPEAPPLENTLTREPDLDDHLLWQLHMSGAPDELRKLAELIVGNLDTDGFLVASLEEIQEMGRIEDGEPFPCEDVERALQLVQSFDPPGVACHDLRESLLAQLDHQ